MSRSGLAYEYVECVSVVSEDYLLWHLFWILNLEGGGVRQTALFPIV